MNNGIAVPRPACAGPPQQAQQQQQQHSYRLLEHLASSADPDAPQFYPCPLCRKPQILDVDALQVRASACVWGLHPFRGT